MAPNPYTLNSTKIATSKWPVTFIATSRGTNFSSTNSLKKSPGPFCSPTELSVDVTAAPDVGPYHLEAAIPGRDDVPPVRSHFAFITQERLENGANMGLRWEVFKGIPGSHVADLTKTKKFQENHPDERTVVDHFEIPRNADDNYGGRATGFLVPPVTGEYVFYLCTDDRGQLFLGDSESSDFENPIAKTTSWTNNRRSWKSPSAAKSRPIHLERGKRYRLRALFKEGSVGAHFAVTWQMPGQTPPQNGDPPIPGLFLRHSPE